ncbi:MAG: S8 family serine peptidase [Acidimicrobiales bacterium]
MKARSCLAGLLAGVGILLPATAGAAPAAERQGDGTSEYVVAFGPGGENDALAAVADAGGTVVDVNEAAGLALVETGNAGFLAEVRADDAVTGAAANHSVGTAKPGMPHRWAEERPSSSDRSAARSGATRNQRKGRDSRVEPLADLQWDMAMIGANAGGAWRKATGRKVQVGVIDTGIDGTHPDLAPNFNRRLSRNFTMDIPDIDGPCEVATCIDPPDVDNDGHGTHVAGTIAAARNGLGIAGIAPDAELVNVRAGQDSGYFFLYETVAALTYAGDIGLDVVNMSFYTDPWLFNCDSRDDYLSGDVTDEQLAEQAMARQTITAALEYAHRKGVTLVAAAGNGHTDYAAPTRFDDSSPDYPGGTEVDRVVSKDCLDLPSEGPHVISVSSVGPSGTKADYSNYGLGSVDLAAPGGWFRDGVGTPTYGTPGNLILSSYPLAAAIEQGLADANGVPVDDFSIVSCDSKGKRCGFYTYLQGTSMASPHVAGVAALIVDALGSHRGKGVSLNPDTVRSVLLRSATDHACPVGGVEIYTDEDRPEEFNAPCAGTKANNGLYGEGILNATAAVSSRR